MKVYRIHRTQWLPVNLQQTWNFFADPGNLQRITPPWLEFQIDPPVDRSMYPGMIINYRIKALAGIPMRWITEITHVDPQSYFVDEQRFGPYKFWHHQHLFHVRDGGVEVEDLVHYGLPMGWMGRLVHRIDIGRRLNEIFDYRHQILRENFS